MTAATLHPEVFAARATYAILFAALPGVTAALMPAHPSWRWRALPVVLGLAYGVTLVLLRHQPLLAGARWTVALQGSRLAVFAWALWIAIRQFQRKSADPGEGMGVLLAWGDGVSVVLGLWMPWWQAQTASAAAWVGVALLVLLAR